MIKHEHGAITKWQDGLSACQCSCGLRMIGTEHQLAVAMKQHVDPEMWQLYESLYGPIEPEPQPG